MLQIGLWRKDDLGWPFLLLSLLHQRDVLFSGKWIVGGNECNNTSIWTQVPRVGGAAKILFSFLRLLTYIVAIKMAKWHGHHDKYVDYHRDQRQYKEVYLPSRTLSTKDSLYWGISHLSLHNGILKKCLGPSKNIGNFEIISPPPVSMILNKYWGHSIQLRDPQAFWGALSHTTYSVYKERSLLAYFWMQNTMGAVSIVNIVWRKYLNRSSKPGHCSQSLPWAS